MHTSWPLVVSVAVLMLLFSCHLLLNAFQLALTSAPVTPPAGASPEAQYVDQRDQEDGE